MNRPEGGSIFVSPGIPLSPIERTGVFLLRLAAWIGLLFIILSACTRGIAVLMAMGDQGNNGFRFLMDSGGALLGNFGIQVAAVAVLFGFASIVENLVALRYKP